MVARPDLAAGPTVLRQTWFDVTPGRPAAGHAHVSATTRDQRLGQTRSRDVGLMIELDPSARVQSLRALGSDASSAGLAALVGRSSAHGFRRALDDLDRTGPLELSLAGTDQCSGWRAGGQMLEIAAAAGGVLAMPLTAPVTPDSLADPAAGALAPLPAMGTRRYRSTSITGLGTSFAITVGHRDSYADPDGRQRRLHEWTLVIELDSAGRFGPITTRAGQRPWVECPLAGPSSYALRGLRPNEVEAAVASWRGIGTCTHLNDAARVLADVDDLIGLDPAAEV